MPRIVVEQASGSSTSSAERQSNYHITISTNVRPTTQHQTDQLVEALAACSEHVFGTDACLARIVHFNKPGHYWDDKYVQSVDMKHAPEVGNNPQGGRVHTHIVLKIKHTSNITITHSVPIIRKLFFETGRLEPLGVKNLYIKIQLIRNEQEALQRYLDKQQNSAHKPPAKSKPAKKRTQTRQLQP